MFVPALIHSLMVKAKVKRLSFDQIFNDKTTMEAKTIHRIMANYEKDSRRKATVEVAAAAEQTDPLEAINLLVKDISDQNKPILEKMEGYKRDLIDKIQGHGEKLGRKLERTKRRLLKKIKNLEARLVTPTPSK